MKSSVSSYISGIGVAVLCFLSLTAPGCARTRVISSDLLVIKLPSGKPFTPAVDGYFVSDRWMLEDVTQLSEQVRKRAQEKK